MKLTVRMTVALLTIFALMAGVPQTTMAKKKASTSTAVKADSKKSKTSKPKKTTAKKTSASKKKKGEVKISKADAAAKKMVADLTTTQKKKLLALLNDGDAKVLSEISGVGKVRGEAIIKARPFESVEDIRKVKGVGAKVFADVVGYGKTLTGRSSKSSTKKTASKKGSSSKTKKSA